VAIGRGNGKSRIQGYRARPARTRRQPSGEDYLLASYAIDVLALGGERDVVVGHSLGDAIAVVALNADRSFAGRLVLEDPLLRLSDPRSFIGAYTKAFDDPSAATVLAQNPRWHPQDARIKAEALEASSPEVVRRTVLENQPWDPTPTAMRIDRPMLLIAADPDEGGFVAPELGDLIAAANSHVTFRVLAGAGHSMHRASYAGFWQAVHSYISG
jgi:pimeloyl-ACP methyl ester carboxylesterase